MDNYRNWAKNLHVEGACNFLDKSSRKDFICQQLILIQQISGYTAEVMILQISRYTAEVMILQISGYTAEVMKVVSGFTWMVGEDLHCLYIPS